MIDIPHWGHWALMAMGHCEFTDCCKTPALVVKIFKNL